MSVGRVRELVIDAWSALSHKAPMQDTPEGRLEKWTPETWMGAEHRRRLTAYTVLAAYDQNVSREFLDGDDNDRSNRREYGDAALVIDQTLAHLLGEEQEIVITGAEGYDAARVAEIEDELASDPAEGEDAPDREALAAELADLDAARALADRQDFLRTWADDVHLPLRLTDSERNAVRSGDAVYILGWDDAQGRPVPAVMDPGFYFPVLPDSLDAYAYPDKVHFAWELRGDDFDDGKTRVRRITYELRDLEPVLDESLDRRRFETEDDYLVAAYSLPENTEWVRVEEDGIEYAAVGRRYPWSPDEVTLRACFQTDATWKLDDLNDAHNVDSFKLENAENVALNDADLEIDFVPVIHVPNTPAGGDHYGQSSLTKVLQLLDDLQNADTDAEAAAALTGSPMVGISGAGTGASDLLTGRRGAGGTDEVRPGLVVKLGENGRMDALDTSANLQAGRDYVTSLLERLSVNSRLPAATLGRLKPSEVPSGFAMQLSFGPLSAMIRQMRLVRTVKYPLFLKMVQRFYQLDGTLPPGPTPRAELALGAFLPSDRQGILAMVKDAYGAKLISLETALTMLTEAGFPIEDIAEEIARIQSRDFEAAERLFSALGDNDEVREFLGREPVAEPEAEPAPGPILQ